MKTKKIITWLGGLGLFMLLINSCEDSLDGTTFFTTDGETTDMTISEVLEANPDKFSMYVEILQKTEFYTALRSYGSYTCLAPTNTAIKAYLQERFNVSTVAELTSEEQIDFLKVLVKFHTLPTSRATSSFIEGRLGDTTYTGDYLTTSYLLGGGIANVQINKEVGLDQYDIRTNNGTIHALTGVLEPFIDPVTVVMEKAGKHTIFIEALKQTGYYEQFSQYFSETGSKNNFTILAESDAVYAQEGINSFAELAERISPGDTDYTNELNELNRFMGYHATESFLYSADFPSDSFVSTVLPKNAIKSFKTDKELKLNETETGVNDTWTSLISEDSNFPAKNGVYHTVNKLFTIFIPKAKYVMFDFGTSLPEFQAGKIGYNTWYDSDRFESVRVFPAVRIRILRNSAPAYDNKSVLNLGAVTWIEFDTPVLPKGKYELRVCGNTGNNGRPIFQTYWDGQPIGSQWDMRSNPSELGIGWPDEDSLELRSLGYVRGLKVGDNNDDKISATSYETAGFARFIIIDDLLMPEQKSHVLRFETIRSGGIPIDYIEFVPVD
ncbi:fasciclin domain-containing protein [Algibacter miyuki]|uniref:Fasciclin domain-containing protein n=1 Tax=Algibacter miyuki TaxID=1306933 RepID=A0ABV5H4P9_9FLAO|nr:fasciclin domain-containing protein [Algibacter miyuki]MDN3665820.1 fasciclin domain-containing protein [Algibacter miyuki]